MYFQEVECTCNGSYLPYISDERKHVDLECAICLEEIYMHNMETLDCSHKFHKACINDWFQEKHDCPKCRTHALPTDDYPSLLSNTASGGVGTRR